MMVNHRTSDFEVAYDTRTCDKNHKTWGFPGRMDFQMFPPSAISKNITDIVDICAALLS